MRIKVRQISQGVEELNWRRLQNDSDRDEEMAEDEKQLLLKSRHPHHHQEEDHSHPNDVTGANGEHGDANNCADSVRYVPKRCKGNCPPSSYEDL